LATNLPFEVWPFLGLQTIPGIYTGKASPDRMMLALDTRFAQIPNESSPSRASVSLSFDRTYLAECEGAMAD
jgi:hypothetical protein